MKFPEWLGLGRGLSLAQLASAVEDSALRGYSHATRVPRPCQPACRTRCNELARRSAACARLIARRFALFGRSAGAGLGRWQHDAAFPYLCSQE